MLHNIAEEPHDQILRLSKPVLLDKTRVAVPEEDWIIVEGTHEPLVSQELWDTVHQAMKARRRENRSGEVQPFAGLVKCADCGSALNVSYDYKKKKYTGFSCWVYKNYGKQRCTSHSIGWVALNELVKNDIRRNARAAMVAPGEYMCMLLSMSNQKQQNDLERIKRTLTQVDKRLAELTKILNKLYEDAALGKISEERYQAMAPTYEQEQRTLSETKTQLEREIFQSNKAHDNFEKYLALIRKYTEVEELNAYILNELIEKIVVHEKVVDEDGNKSQQIDIYYKYVGNINLKQRMDYTKEYRKQKMQELVQLGLLGE